MLSGEVEYLLKRILLAGSFCCSIFPIDRWAWDISCANYPAVTKQGEKDYYQLIHH